MPDFRKNVFPDWCNVFNFLFLPAESRSFAGYNIFVKILGWGLLAQF